MASSLKKRRSRPVHRWLGLVLVLPLVVASLTGVALNHSSELGLENRRLTNSVVRHQYGMVLNGEPVAYGFGGKAYAARWDSRLFHGGEILDSSDGLIGAVPLRDGVAVVTENAVHYFGLDGALIETLDALSLPATPITRAGRTDELILVLETTDGLFIADSNLLEFTAADPGTIADWSERVLANPTDRERWERAYLGDGVPLDRVILDIHSGRFFGTWGKWVWDILVFGIMFLSATGLVLFFRARRSR